MLVRYILIALAIYVVYKVVFDLVIPVFRATKQVRKQFRNMQEHMQQEANRARQGQEASGFQKTNPSPKTPAGEYIDFEEIKQ